MGDVKSAWTDAGEKLQGLGATLKQHYEQQRGEDSGAAREQVNDAFKKVGEALHGAFDALGAAAKDPVVKEDVKRVGKSVTDALGVTFSEISDDVRKTFDKRKGETGDDRAATSEGTPAAPAEGTGTPEPSAQWTAPATSDSTAAPAGPQDSGVDGGTAPPKPGQDPSI